MKKLFFALCFVLGMCTIVSCEDNETDLASSLIGTWKLVLDDQDLNDYSAYQQFKRYGGLIVVNDDRGDVDVNYGTWELDGHSLSITIKGADLDGYGNSTETLIIMNLTKRTLSLWYEGEEMLLERVPDSEIEKYL